MHTSVTQRAAARCCRRTIRSSLKHLVQIASSPYYSSTQELNQGGVPLGAGAARSNRSKPFGFTAHHAPCFVRNPSTSGPADHHLVLRGPEAGCKPLGPSSAPEWRGEQRSTDLKRGSLVFMRFCKARIGAAN
ncbi:hypothetical protein NDU88_002753 [Pleurodeles waltl]|uniref:Uncharacterized protein n=1 Tax=Pleurodeles waltl TaxID=8319 RepID=A0AAV7T4K4_PLEWA|nr:hypothetical protein NDU88_002753 [Pleurodeles waltl]